MVSDDSTDKIEREEARERGILSGPDRKWLLMDRDEFIEEHSRQYWGQRRDKVKSRIRHALLDFSLLFEHLDGEVWKDLVGGRTGQRMNFGDQQLKAGIRDAFAFLLRLCGGENNLVASRDDNTVWQIFREAWERLAWDNTYQLNRLEVNLEAEPIPWREYQERAKAGEELTIDEQAQLLMARRDDVDPAESQELLSSILFAEDEE